MPTKTIVPLLGEGVEEVSIVNWLVEEGQEVEEEREVATGRRCHLSAAGSLSPTELPAGQRNRHEGVRRA